LKNELVHLTYNDEPATEKADDDNNNQAAYAILYLMDKFGISDQFYHELSMVNPFLPRSLGVIVQLKNA
jgi:hypothetical protein